MKSVGQDATRDLLLLSLAAGGADAIGFLGLGHAFTSNMTGNLVLLGIHLGQGNFLGAVHILYVLAFFISGVCLGAWLGHDLPEKNWSRLGFRLVGMEKIALLLFGLGWFWVVGTTNNLGAHLILALLAIAMGLQSAVMGRLSAPGVATTAVTGTITALATGTMNLLFLSKSQLEQIAESRERIWFQFRVVLLYGGGAALAGWLILHLPVWAGFFPALATILVVRRRPGT